MCIIRRLLCFCCDSPDPSTKSPLLSPKRPAVNIVKPNTHTAGPQTPDSAYGDVDTYQGAVTNSKTPPKGQYGQVPVDKYA